MFLSLDFLYLPAPDFEAALGFYTRVLGARVVWKVGGMGTVVARLELTEGRPALQLAEHLAGGGPILIYRAADLAAAVAELAGRGLPDGERLEIPHGPCHRFDAPGGQRFAVYELARPGVEAAWVGRIDP